jgi:hypothetical protein
MKIILLSTAIFLNLFCFTQDFAPIGATWHYTENTFSNSSKSFFKIESVQDSLFLGKNCKLLIKNDEFECENRPLVVLVYEEDSAVYFWDEVFNEFQTLYDLKKQVNESWIVKVKNLNQNTDTIVARVTNLNTTIINSSTLKVLDVVYSVNYQTSGTEYSWSSKIIEKIGDTTFLFNFHPESILFCDANSSGGLRCFEDDVLGFYTNFTSPSCEYDNLSIDDLNEKDLVRIYPNPCESTFQITGLQNDEIYTAYLYDLMGRKIRNFDVKNNSICDVNGLNNGVYELLIIGKNKVIKDLILVN